MSQILTTHDIIELAKNDEFLRIDMDSIRVLEEKNTMYMPLQINNKGVWQPLKFKYTKQILASGLLQTQQKPQRNAVVCFKQINIDELHTTKHNKSNYENILSSNSEFIRALELINNEYVRIVNNLIKKSKFKKITFDKKNIHSFKQTLLKSGEPLKDPLYRLRIPCDENGFLGYRIKSGSLIPIVTDYKNPENDLSLSIHNGRSFITKYSIAAGIIHFTDICYSVQGFSLLNRFNKMQLVHYKPDARELLTSDEKIEMNEFEINEPIEDL